MAIKRGSSLIGPFLFRKVEREGYKEGFLYFDCPSAAFIQAKSLFFLYPWSHLPVAEFGFQSRPEILRVARGVGRGRRNARV